MLRDCIDPYIFAPVRDDGFDLNAIPAEELYTDRFRAEFPDGVVPTGRAPYRHTIRTDDPVEWASLALGLFEQARQVCDLSVDEVFERVETIRSQRVFGNGSTAQYVVHELMGARLSLRVIARLTGLAHHVMAGLALTHKHSPRASQVFLASDLLLGGDHTVSEVKRATGLSQTTVALLRDRHGLAKMPSRVPAVKLVRERGIELRADLSSRAAMERLAVEFPDTHHLLTMNALNMAWSRAKKRGLARTA